MLSDRKECYICGSQRDLQVHHIFSGPNRDNSTKYGMMVYLCRYHHTGDIKGNREAVHFNRANDLRLKRDAEERWLEDGHTEEEFREIFGKWW